jgi:chemotaxis protein methyltransferase CheR
VTIDASGFNFVRRLVLARREGLASAQDVIDRLRAAPAGPLQRKVIEAMTTTETLFFRDTKPYEALRNTIVPELARLRAGERRLQIWSSACSSGQEPYSIAMVMREHFPALAAWSVRVLATDISTEMLARARTGRYSQLEVNRGLPIAYLKYFEKAGLDWQIRGDLRGMIELRELNLAGTWSAMPPTDLVMLRNVLIYFDVETKRQILARIRKILRPGGFLVLGTAETTINLDDSFELVRSDGTTYYRVRDP